MLPRHVFLSRRDWGLHASLMEWTARAMLMPESTPILCPQCQTPMRMTLQAELRAKDVGVAVECSECGGSWLYVSEPVPQFGPLLTPKRRRGRSIQLTDDDPPDIEIKGRE